jgi:virginiamycin A acetyltransferase
MRQKIKRAVDLCCRAAVALPAAMCALEAALSPAGDVVFSFWAQTFAMLPGLPGVSLRRAFYKLTLDECADSFFIGFGALFSHRHSKIEQDAYVGPYAVIGSAWLERLPRRHPLQHRQRDEHALAGQRGALDGDRRPALRPG